MKRKGKRKKKFVGTPIAFRAALQAAVFFFLGYQLAELIHLNYSIVCLIVGVLVTSIGIVPKDILEKGK